MNVYFRLDNAGLRVKAKRFSSWRPCTLTVVAPWISVALRLPTWSVEASERGAGGIVSLCSVLRENCYVDVAVLHR
jgi:hypothetical protein